MDQANAAVDRRLTIQELQSVAGGLDDETQLLTIAALASPSPYNPKEPGYSDSIT